MEAAIIDMDGTVHRDGELIEGAGEAIEAMRNSGLETLFLTNYAGHKREHYVDQLDTVGIEVSKDEIVTSGTITANYLEQEHPSAEVFVLGEEELKETLEEAGVNVVESAKEAEVIVVSNYKDLYYDDLKQVLQGVDAETSLIGTNPDETLPGDEGEIPGAGTVIGAVETMTGREVEVVGKPSETALNVMAEELGGEPRDCLIAGDRINTDMEMGEKAGMRTVLVLSGVTSRSDAESSEVSPDHVLESIAEINEVL